MAPETGAPQPTGGGGLPSDQTALLQHATQAIVDMQGKTVDAIEKLAGVADKGASNLLLAFGVVLSLTSWLSDVIAGYVPLAHVLPSGDFIAVQAVAIAALAGGAAIRIYAFKRQEDSAQASRQTTATAMQRVVELHQGERAAELQATTAPPVNPDRPIVNA